LHCVRAPSAAQAKARQRAWVWWSTECALVRMRRPEMMKPLLVDEYCRFRCQGREKLGSECTQKTCARARPAHQRPRTPAHFQVKCGVTVRTQLPAASLRTAWDTGCGICGRQATTCLHDRLHEPLRVLGGALHRLGKVVQRLARHARAVVVVHVRIMPACAPRIPGLLLCAASQLSRAACPATQLCSAKATASFSPARSSTSRRRLFTRLKTNTAHAIIVLQARQ